MKSLPSLAEIFVIGELLNQESSSFLREVCPTITAVPPAFAGSHPRWISEKRRGNTKIGLGEAGCLLAHEDVWAQINEREANQGSLFLVLEDDARITAFGKKTFRKIVRYTSRNNSDLVNLGKEILRIDPDAKHFKKWVTPILNPIVRKAANVMPPIFLPNFDWRTRAYLISKNLASELVANPLPFSEPVDKFLRETSRRPEFRGKFKASTLMQTIFGDSGRVSLVDTLGRADKGRG